MRESLTRKQLESEIEIDIEFDENFRFNSPSKSNLFINDADSWAKELLHEIERVIAPLAIPGSVNSEAHRNKIVQNTKAQETWIAAFTHLSFNRNHGGNYERLEFAGDRALKTAFAKYVFGKFPDVDEDKMTKMESYYMAKYVQNRIAEEMGLDQWIRAIKDTIDVHVREDVFESLFGAVLVIGDEVIGKQAGMVLVQNLMENILNEIGVSPEKVKSPFKTDVKEILEGFGLITMGELRDFVTLRKRADGNWMFKATFPEGSRDKLLGYRGIFFDEIDETSPIVEIIGLQKSSVQTKGYHMLLEKLSSLGITKELLESQKADADAEFYGNLFDRAKRIANSYGYDNLELAGNKKDGPVQFIQVVGVKGDIKDILYTKIGGSGNTGTKRKEALEEFIKQNISRGSSNRR